MWDRTKWQTKKDEFLWQTTVASFFAWFFLGEILYIYTSDFFKAVSLSFLLVVVIAGGIVSQLVDKQVGFSKTYVGVEKVAHQIVRNVLASKNLPYKQHGHRYQILFTDVFIRIRLKSSYGIRTTRSIFYQPPGARIEIGSQSEEDLLLVESLMGKLDEAFTPRGL